MHLSDRQIPGLSRVGQQLLTRELHFSFLDIDVKTESVEQSMEISRSHAHGYFRGKVGKINTAGDPDGRNNDADESDVGKSILLVILLVESILLVNVVLESI